MHHLGALLMPSLPSSRLARRLAKLASLGLAGLLAGLLSGCHSFSTEDDASTPPAATTSSTWEFTPANIPGANLPPSLDAVQIPALHHPPSARRLEYGSAHLLHQAAFPNSPHRS
jgi:hypothetical protein